ncbi:bifunctional 3,4-dihydroxy-2-butanone-4-phosphate synthase/GTP cyclohydrolase II [Oceanotoga teriensis]|jgi:3,4-dihydroxy 2-butanone 4-phosphate synthase/GTP cyclohydrolase II|uniref:GTP cyclohydrolase-2 n=1 Tax=Oceanotoga teriensis TaxID=515440 RepID=A0AA45HJP6_9BACT|nr:bifunctional 3,4-dihydroxy-2-butanone-4-phosphate synthase/GTP cyclohydrolase II [Oceanotoga teriensis]MDO7977602.1 bifunctional 3,4-dihydroxy-2-butanone-4-phosphate synthase/GTP cyclohydrolase II [Oceanotoga teriensis]PWJ96451.1 3,4-dihydroxy 2-butanone 4-phosphate synthase/GTP cyclohydrolase II [Oceanotoga teriensis]
MDIENIKKDFELGKPVIILDTKREIEGDMVFPSELMDEKIINLFIQKGRGLLCTAADENILLDGGFIKLPSNNKEKFSTNFFIPIDYKLSNTGISSIERANTVSVLSENPNIGLFAYPGHVSLIGGRGLNNRKGHTEASIELMSILGYKRFSSFVEIIDDNGESHNLKYIENLAKELQIRVITIDEIYEEYIKRVQNIFMVSKAKLPTKYGEFEIIAFKNNLDKKEHFVIKKGDFYNKIPYVRVHSECVTGDVMSSLKCDCGSQLNNYLKFISENDGILIYMRQEGRDIGITNKIKTYALQDKGVDTYDANEVIGLPADNRDYSNAAQILKAMEVNKIKLLTNNPDKIKQLSKYGIDIEESINLYGEINEYNEFYLKTKKIRFNHNLNV